MAKKNWAERFGEKAIVCEHDESVASSESSSPRALSLRRDSLRFGHSAKKNSGVPMAFLRQAVLLVVLVGACWAHPDGAPASACATMNPEHNDSKHEEAGPSTPYTLVQDKKDFKAGDTVAVTLSGAPFKGFFIKAFDDKNKEIGQFEASGESKPVTECSGVTHTNSAEKTAVKVLWKAPAGASGHVQFRQVAF
ncbi:hypothetical protein V5799_024440 [Amblyomma americanum]|uniref:Reelin domain-containing protein n=1 Tax=Amblyomma americanum TaxID=6943 RepID=A0AAQ4EC53_AMBAM